MRGLEQRAADFHCQPVLNVVDGRERLEHRPAQLQQSLRHDDLNLPPEEASAVAAVAVPPLARPRLIAIGNSLRLGISPGPSSESKAFNVITSGAAIPISFTMLIVRISRSAG